MISPEALYTGSINVGQTCGGIVTKRGYITAGSADFSADPQDGVVLLAGQKALLFLPNGAGSLQSTPVTISLPPGGWNQIVAGDVTGDGIADIAVADTTAGVAQIMASTGWQQYALGQSLAIPGLQCCRLCKVA